MRDHSPPTATTFRFTGFDFDEVTGIARLGYALEDRHGVVVDMVEEILFPKPAHTLTQPRREAFLSVLRLVHLVAGMSYYKAGIPPKIEIDGAGIDSETARFLKTLYLNGLSEFAYRNELDLKDRLDFPVTRDVPACPVDLEFPDRALIAVGGGKDSIVTVEAMKQTGRACSAAIVGHRPLIEEVVEVSGLDLHRVGRRIAPELLELNRGGAWNGHVAITAIVSSILLATAVLQEYDAVVMSNERSAEQGNLVRVGAVDVNHQYSKSLEFERLLARYVESRVVGGVAYFSLLRPLSELAICRLFASHRSYHAVFSSCNANFKISGDRPEARWCLICPKCHFVFLSLAPFMGAETLQGLFGADLLDDPGRRSSFDDLLGFGGRPKPFECVGETDEARAAFVMLADRPDYKDKAVVRNFVETHLPRIPDPAGLVDRALTPSDDHDVPERYREELRAIL